MARTRRRELPITGLDEPERTEPPLIAFAAWVYAFRLARGLSPQAVAEQAGISEERFQRIERASNHALMCDILAVSEFLGFRIQDADELPLGPLIRRTFPTRRSRTPR